MLRVDNGGHTQYVVLCIIDDRVDIRISDDGQIPGEVFVRFIYLHELCSGVHCFPAERRKSDVGWCTGFVSERRGEGVEVMCSDGDEASPPPDVLVQFVLEVDEECVAHGYEF